MAKKKQTPKLDVDEILQKQKKKAALAISFERVCFVSFASIKIATSNKGAKRVLA